MGRWSSLVACQRLSSSIPNFSKSRSRPANSGIWNYQIKDYQRLHAWAHASGTDFTHNKLLEGLKSTIRTFSNISTKKANSEKLGLGIENPRRRVFFFFSEFAGETVHFESWHCWNPDNSWGTSIIDESWGSSIKNRRGSSITNDPWGSSMTNLLRDFTQMSPQSNKKISHRHIYNLWHLVI